MPDKEKNTLNQHNGLADIERVAEEEINQIMSKYDRESAYRTFSDFRAQVIAVICVAFSVIQLYHAVYAITYMRALHLAIVLLLAFILYPAKRSMPKNTLPGTYCAGAAGFGVHVSGGQPGALPRPAVETARDILKYWGWCCCWKPRAV